MLQDFSNSLDYKDLCIIKKFYTSSFEKYLIRRSVMKRFRVTTFQSGEFHVYKFAPYISMDMRNFFVTGF